MEDILFSLPVLYQSNFSNVNHQTSHVSTWSIVLKIRMIRYLYTLIQINIQMQFVNYYVLSNYGLDVEIEESSNILCILKMSNIVNFIIVNGYL